MYNISLYNIPEANYKVFRELIHAIYSEKELQEVNIFDLPIDLYYDLVKHFRGERTFYYKDKKIKYRKANNYIDFLTLTTYNKKDFAEKKDSVDEWYEALQEENEKIDPFAEFKPHNKRREYMERTICGKFEPITPSDSDKNTN